MTEDHLWLGQQHAWLADEVQRCRLFFAEAQAHRAEVAPLWNDACAREMNGRFLDPQATEAAASLERLRIQHEALVGCGFALTEAGSAFATTTSVSLAVQRNLEEGAALFRNIESYLNQATAEMRTSAGHADRADQLADEADVAGNSAESESSYRG
jgi:hypothetical protein